MTLFIFHLVVPFRRHSILLYRALIQIHTHTRRKYNECTANNKVNRNICRENAVYEIAAKNQNKRHKKRGAASGAHNMKNK